MVFVPLAVVCATPSRVFKANNISTLSYQLMTVPALQTQPKNKLPDPKRDPDWFGEIWLKYPSSSVLIPIQVGLTFQTKMNFAVVLNEAMLGSDRDSNEDDLAQNGSVRIISVVKKLESWYQSLPEPLSPSNIVFPSHLKIQYTSLPCLTN